MNKRVQNVEGQQGNKKMVIRKGRRQKGNRHVITKVAKMAEGQKGNKNLIKNIEAQKGNEKL